MGEFRHFSTRGMSTIPSLFTLKLISWCKLYDIAKVEWQKTDSLHVRLFNMTLISKAITKEQSCIPVKWLYIFYAKKKKGFIIQLRPYQLQCLYMRVPRHTESKI